MRKGALLLGYRCRCRITVSRPRWKGERSSPKDGGCATGGRCGPCKEAAFFFLHSIAAVKEPSESRKHHA